MPDPGVNQSSYLTPRQKKRAFPDDSPRMSRHGEAAKIVGMTRGTCPRCGNPSLYYKDGKEEGCELCGYHNVRHAGTPRPKTMKKQDGSMMVAGAAQQAAEEGKKMAMAPVKALGGVLSHAAAVGSQQPKTATQNIVGGAGNIALGSAGLAGAAYKKWKESDDANKKQTKDIQSTAEKQETPGEQKGTYSTSVPVQQPMSTGNTTPQSQEAINAVDVVGDQKAKEEQQMQQQNAKAMATQQQNQNIKKMYGAQ